MSGLITELIQRYASRKFLIPVGFAALLYYDHQLSLGIDNTEFFFLAVLCGLFIWQEGQADVEDRRAK